MAFWINIYGCQSCPKDDHLCSKSAQKRQLLLGTVTYLLLGKTQHLHLFPPNSGLYSIKDLFIKIRTRTVVKLLLFWFEFLLALTYSVFKCETIGILYFSQKVELVPSPIPSRSINSLPIVQKLSDKRKNMITKIGAVNLVSSTGLKKKPPPPILR